MDTKMGRLANSRIEICSAPLEFDTTPRVYVRLSGDDYEELPGVTSFERTVEEGSDNILIAIRFAPSGDAGLQNRLVQASGKEIDVKMEFMFGMLMVMSFSGFIEEISGEQLVISVSTPIATDVQDIAQ